MDDLLKREPSPGEGDSINDLVAPGSDAPGTILTSSHRYVRDHQVRQAVLERAGGYCEYCGVQGFLKLDGTHYLECHHIIALSAEGKDHRTNVIALCPGDHRGAHFAADWAVLERRMIQIVQRKGLRNVFRLYYSPGTFSLAPHIVLEEVGCPYELELCSTRNGEGHRCTRIPGAQSEGQGSRTFRRPGLFRRC
jgi:hypothetical protein